MRKSIAAAWVFSQLCAAATATAKDVPFTLTGSPDGFYIQCNGPWFRTSGCAKIVAGDFGFVDNWNFYTAEDNFLFPITDRWNCWVTTSGPDQSCDKHTQPTEVFFRIDNNTTAVRLSAAQFELKVEGAAPPNARAVYARSALGQNGEDAGRASDFDRFDFAGETGETIEAKLDRDGAAGSMGRIATLRLLDRSGATLAQRTGELPLEVKASLASPGLLVEVAQVRADGGFRGYYSLRLTPTDGEAGDRRIKPTGSVEH
jgi:hypothetical protein